MKVEKTGLHRSLWVRRGDFIYLAKQNRVRFSLQSILWCGPVAGTCTIWTSGPSSCREPASDLSHLDWSQTSEAEKGPANKKRWWLESKNTRAFPPDTVSDQANIIGPHAGGRLQSTPLRLPAGPHQPQPSSFCRTRSRRESHTPELKHKLTLLEKANTPSKLCRRSHHSPPGSAAYYWSRIHGCRSRGIWRSNDSCCSSSTVMLHITHLKWTWTHRFNFDLRKAHV